MIINLPKLGPVRFSDKLSQEEFQAELNRLSTKYDFELPKRDYGLMGSFTKGVSRGATRLGETFGDVIPALGAKALGFDEYAQAQMAEAKATEEKLARENPAQFESYKQVGGVRDAAKYALETLGETTPDILTAIGSGGVGGALAKRGAAKLAERELAAITPGLVETGASAGELAQVAGRVGAEASTKRQLQGQAVGAYLGSFALNTPEVFQSIYSESGQLAPGAALLFGSVSAALDSILPASVLRSMSPAMKAKVTEKVLQQSGMRPGLAKNITTGVLKGVGTEALTESAQEAINIAAEGFVNQNRDMWTSDDFNRIVESGVRGAVAGGAFGAVGGVGKNSQEKQAAADLQAKELADIQAERDRQQSIVDQAQAEQAAREAQDQELETQAARRSQANLPLPLPGFEEAVGPAPLQQTEEAPVETTLKDIGGGAAQAIKENLYGGLFEALRQGKSKFAGITDPVLARAKPAFDAGLIKSAEDLQRFENQGYPEGQQDLFGASGKPTKEALASVKAGPIAAAKAEKEALVAQKQALDELAPKNIDLMQNVRMQDTGLSVSSPLQSLINQAQDFGPKGKKAVVKPQAEVSQEVVEEPATNKINDGLLKSLGIGPTANIRKKKILEGLDPAIPEDADRIRQVLGAYIESPNLSGAISEKVDAYLSTLPTTQKEVVTPVAKEVIAEETPTQTEKEIKADIKAKPPLSADTMTSESAERVTMEDTSENTANYVLNNILDSVRTDLDNEGVPTRAEGRKVLEQLEAEHIQKYVNKKALVERVLNPIKAVNILREVLDLQSSAMSDRPNKKTTARIKKLEGEIRKLGRDVQAVYNGLKGADVGLANDFFTALNTDTKAELDALVAEAKERAYPKGKYSKSVTSRVFVPDDNKNNLTDVIERRKRELKVREPEKLTLKEAVGNLIEELAKVSGTKANFIADTPPDVMKALRQVVEALISEGVRSIKDLTAKIRAELGDNVFRTVNPKDIKSLFDEEIKKYKAEKAGAAQRKAALETVNAPAEIYESLPVGDQKIYDGALNAYSNAEDSVQGAMLRLWSLNDLIDVFGNKFPTLKNLLSAIEKRASTSDKARGKVAELVRKGDKLIKSLSPETYERFNDVVLELSRLKLDPRPANTKDQNHPEVKRFHALPQAVQDYAIELADQYDAYGKQYLDFLVNQIPMKNNREYLTNVEKMKAKFESGRIPFYFPLLRSGEYWVSYKDTNGERVVFARESKREAEVLAQALAKAGGTEVTQYTQMSQMNHRTAPPTGFMAEIIKNLEQAKVSDTVINGIYSSYLDLFPSESLRQQFKPREGLKGYEKDVVQGFAQVGSRMAQQLANMESAPEIGQAIAGVKAVYDNEPSMANRNVLENIQRQEAFLSNPVAAPLASRLSYASYFQFILGNPSSAVINLTQLPIVVYSLLSGRYGYGKAASAMTKAMSTYFKQGGWDTNNPDMPDWTFGANAKGDIADLYNQAVDRSAIRRGSGYELTEMRKTNTKDYTGTWSKIQHGLGYLFQNSERFNREVTLLAAYNLARNEVDPVLKRKLTHQEAIDAAIKLNTDSHSHALSEAGPQLFQTGWGKVLTTFKRFAQAQIALLLKLARKAYKGESPEVRSVARKQIASIFGMAYLFSGIQGMPFYGAAEVLVSGLYAALGDDDEPFDSAEALREAVGDLGYKGPLNQMLGVDIASRTGFNGLLWRDDKKRLAEVGPILYATERLLGPAYSVFYDNPKRALDYLEKGQGDRALEAVLPSFMRNALKGVRFANEGALNSKGVPIVDDISAYNSLMQIFGFTPAELSEAYARAGSMKSAENYINARRTALLDALYLAKTNTDADDIADVYEAIANFNAAHPDNPITTKTEKRSETMHNKAMTQYVDGVRLNPKTKDYYIENYGN
jgi:hypothetical protein